jgi:hypothetical protein
VEEVDGEFVLPLEGFVCTEIAGEWLHELILRHDDEVAVIDGVNEGVNGAAVRELVGRAACITRAIATYNSLLRVDFDGGDSIEIPSLPNAQAWEVRRQGILVAAGSRGDGPLIWDSWSKGGLLRPRR